MREEFEAAGFALVVVSVGTVAGASTGNGTRYTW